MDNKKTTHSVVFSLIRNLREIILHNIFIHVFLCLLHAVANVEHVAAGAAAAYVPHFAYVFVGVPVIPFLPEPDLPYFDFDDSYY